MRAALLATILIASAACQASSPTWVTLPASADSSGTVITFKGVVEHSDLEGGVYTIRASDGTNYNPLNLPTEFQKPGMAVEAEARKRNDMAGIHQVGPIVQLIRIRAQ